MFADNIAGRIDEHQRRPRTNAVLLPDLEVAVVDDGMVDLVAQNGSTQVLGLLLSREFGGVDAHDCEFTSVLFFQFPQLRKYVHAVNSTVGPKIEDHQSAAKVCQAQRVVGVQPVKAVDEFGRDDGPGRSSG